MLLWGPACRIAHASQVWPIPKGKAQLGFDQTLQPRTSQSQDMLQASLKLQRLLSRHCLSAPQQATSHVADLC